MQTLFNQFSQVLGTTLLNSLWQGLIVYALLRIVLMCVPSASASNKYNLGLLALAASVAWPVVTFVIELSRHPMVTTVADTDAGPLAYITMTHAYREEVTNTISFAIDRYLPYLVVLWFIGIALNSARLLWGWRNIYLIKQSVTNITVFEDSVHIIQNILGISKKVQVFLSEYVDVPCIVGYLKPMIIIPAGIITQFSAEQIKSILIHEMAHIRRNDYFINVIQQVIGILFFFNPFTHLINKIIYHEREHCCDDLVLQITGEPLIYAQTLLKLEETRGQDIQLALAATGQKNYLLNRIKRMMETKKQVSNIRHILAAVLLLISSMGTIAWLNPEIKDGKISISPVRQIVFPMPDDNDTLKKAIAKKKVAAKAGHVRHTGSKTAPGQIAFPKPKASNKQTFNYDYNDNPTLQKLSAEVDKRSNVLSKYYDSPEYHAIEKQMEAKSRAIDSFYNRPEMKKLQEEMEAKEKEFSKLNENLEMKELTQKIEKLGKEQSDYFESAEYKKLQKSFDEQAKWFEQPGASKSAEFKKRSAELEKAGENLRNYTGDKEHKANTEQLRAYSKQMHDYYESPDYKRQRDEVVQLGKQITKTYQNPEVKKQQDEIRALSKKMRDYTNSPEIKKAKQELNLASAKLREYTNSPAFKKLRDEMQKNNRAMYQRDKVRVDTVNKEGK